ncbi:MAG: hypothetical protein AAGF12_02175, partial [Myxococcota bacterium]
SDFLPVINALTSLQTTQLTLLTAQRQRISNRVQLYRALGGTWTMAMVAPEPLELREVGEQEGSEE